MFCGDEWKARGAFWVYGWTLENAIGFILQNLRDTPFRNKFWEIGNRPL
jgi:hypothetical protein